MKIRVFPTTIEIKCSQCGEIFSKLSKEYRRKIKNNPRHKFYCKTECRNLGARRPERSGLSILLNVSKHSRTAKIKSLGHELDLEFLTSLWEKQKGVCPYTGIAMELPTHDRNVISKPNKASIDRIDPSKGYVKDNVEIVCMAINLAKNRFSKKDIKDFLSSIINR